MPDSEKRSPVTIEDLLKLKRAERPSAEFWNDFERELRQKQLTALMQRRSWWQDLPLLLSRRAYLPAGAAAIIAFTLVTVKYSTPTLSLLPEPQSQPAVAAASASLAGAPVPLVVSTAVSSPLVNRKEHSLPIDDRVPISASNYPAAAQPDLPLLVTVESRDELTPSARSIAANLARLEQSEPELISSVMGNRLSAAIKPATDSGAAVEFASLSSPGGRRSRLLAQYGEQTLNAGPGTSEVVRERMARRLSDLNDGDRFTRIGLKGDQVSLKF